MPTVFIPTVLRPFSGGRDQVTVPGRTLRQVFDQLDRECPGIKAQLVVDDDLHPGLAVVVDDELTAEGLLTAVGEDAAVHILPAMSGGSLRDGKRLPPRESRSV